MRKRKIGFIVMMLLLVLVPIISAAENPIKINEIETGKDFINISYEFDNSEFVGDTIDIEIWIIDFNLTEITREVDSFSIRKTSPIKRNLIIEVPKKLVGVYNVYFALSSDQENFVKQSVVFGETKTTGNVVLGEGSTGKLTIYIIFIVIVVAVIILISKSLFLRSKLSKEDHSGPVDPSGSKHGWLLARETEKK